MEIRKYMGIISISQKIKNRSRSREANTPRMLVSSSSSQMKYSLTLVWTFYDMRIDKKPRKVVNITIGILKPSTPT